MRVVAIVQARLGSKRLPRKVLADLGGEPAIVRLLRNLLTVPELDEVCLAGPKMDTDLCDIVYEWQPICRVTWHGGSTNDVLSRYAEAAEACEADVIVRITGDCPLIDPALVSAAIKRYQRNKTKWGYLFQQGAPRGVGDIELFSRRALDRADERETDKYRREHVWHAVALCGSVSVPWVPDEIRRPSYRLCIDEQADLDAVRAVLDALGNPPVASAQEIVALLDSRPDLVAINANVRQAS